MRKNCLTGQREKDHKIQLRQQNEPLNFCAHVERPEKITGNSITCSTLQLAVLYVSSTYLRSDGRCYVHDVKVKQVGGYLI